VKLNYHRVKCIGEESLEWKISTQKKGKKYGLYTKREKCKEEGLKSVELFHSNDTGVFIMSEYE
jgi:hypothetical protein